jgi:hypothetical protein
MAAHRCQERGVGVNGADRFNLLAKGLRVIGFGLGIQPIAAAMGLKSRLPLKSV